MKIRILLFNIMFLLCHFQVLAQKDEPILVINTQGHSAMINDVAFTPDGQYVISVSNDKTMRFWDCKTGILERTLRAQIGDAQDGMLYCSAISANGLFFAVAGYPSKYGIRVFNLETGEQSMNLSGNSEIINDICFSPDNKMLASASTDSCIRIWLLDKSSVHTPAAVLKIHKASVSSISFTPDSRGIVSASLDSTVAITRFEYPKFENTSKHLKHSDVVLCAAITSNGKYIATGSGDGTLSLWDGDGNFLKKLDNFENSVQTVSFSKDGKVLAAFSKVGVVYEIPSGKRRISFTKHNNSVKAATFLGNDTIVSAGGNNNDIYLWNANTTRELQHFVGQGGSVWSVAFGKGYKLAFGQTPYFLNANNRGQLEKGFDFSAFALDTVLTNEFEYTRARTEWNNRTLIDIDNTTLSVEEGDSGLFTIKTDKWLRCYTFTNDGKIIVGTDFTLKIYNGDGSFLRQFKGHTGHIWAVSISQDGKILASASDDQTICLWNVETAELLATLFVSDNNEWVCWSGNYYSVSDNGKDFIGWHKNMGINSIAEYYPLNTYRKKYYKPYLVEGAIMLGSFKKAFKKYLKQIEKE